VVARNHVGLTPRRSPSQFESSLLGDRQVFT
jgi:hypothetical protein